MNSGHLLDAEEHGFSFGGIKNEVVMRGPTTELVNSLLYLGIALVDGRTVCNGHRALCRRRIGGL